MVDRVTVAAIGSVLLIRLGQSPGIHSDDELAAALRRLAEDDTLQAGVLAGISGVVACGEEGGRHIGTPPNKPLVAAVGSDGVPVTRGLLLWCEQIVAATDVGVSAARPAAPGETIAAALALADEAGRREQLARAVSARLVRDAQHVMRVTAHTERMISILHEWQRSDIQHADHT
ncbi:hypothetical protein ABZ922_12715 [Streptomyces shenzhenensis]|uniref:hypothetical protein n=1 Tax=Streptomyces shenzhenensis TaxID=943815 RepID=UPI003406F18E